ncbi:MAG: UvrD-helicase domain-containing protein [Clostridia bacterium]|nr:UvrD-helicase domain-containing protein [Clostridia bacterium]
MGKLDKNTIISLKRQAFDAYYSFLNEMQRKAVYTVNGPLLVLAGAGTGKTTVLVNRIANILNFGDAYYSDSCPGDLSDNDIAILKNAENCSKEELFEVLSKFRCGACGKYDILAITFTNKAANEMKTRLNTIINDDYGDMWVGTFHSICVRILRINAERIGYTHNFTIYDTDDSKKLMSDCMKRLNIDDKILPLSTALKRISHAKNELTDAESFASNAAGDFRDSQIATIYELYQHELHKNNAFDFDDLIMQTVKLLAENDDIRDKYSRKFKYISVDEYQDTNYAQSKLIELLARVNGNIMAVGDDDQSIYKFRGATIKNILEFDKVFKDCTIIKLEENYRSTSNILNAANSVIRNNKSRRGKELFTKSGSGEKVHIKRMLNQIDEARFIISMVKEGVIKNGRSFSDYAILYRMNAQANAIQTAFSRSGIPFRIIGGRRFYEKKEIRDVIAYLTVINNPADDQRLLRIINEPKRKIGDSTIDAVKAIAEEKETDLFHIMSISGDIPALCKVCSKLEKFTDMIMKLKANADTLPLPELLDMVLDATGYREMLLTSGDDEDRDRLENIEELKSSMAQYELDESEPTLEGFLQSISLVTDIDNYDKEANAVVMMTIHSAKGLEFPVVFLPGMEEGVFPSMQSEIDPSELEEERRLAYVAITRAKEELYLIHCSERMLYGKTSSNPVSRFASEIEPEFTDAVIYKRPNVIEKLQSDNVRRKHQLSNEILKDSTELKNVGKTQGYETFAEGDRVSHLTFGEGVIISAKPMGADTMYEINFDLHGKKRLMATYAKLTRAE